MQRRKVSSEIPKELHTKITRAARSYRTTIGHLVEFGLRLAIERLDDDTSAGMRLPKDPRYSAD